MPARQLPRRTLPALRVRPGKGLRRFLSCLALVVTLGGVLPALWPLSPTLTTNAAFAAAREPTARELAAMTDPSFWRLSPEAEHLYYYLLLSEGLADNSQLVIAHALRGLLKLDPSLPVYQDSATILLARGEYLAAQNTAASGLRQFPGDSLLTLLLAGAYSENDEVKKAISLLETFLKKTPDDAQVTEELVRLYLRDGQDKKASDLLARLPKSDDSPEAELFRAGVLSTVGRNTEARQILQKLLADNPSLFEAWLELAYLFENDNNYSEAVRAYSRAAELMPDNPELWLRIASLHIRQNDPDKALEAMYRAAPSAPLYIQAAVAFTEEGFYGQALLMLDKAEKNGAGPDETALLHSMILEESTNDPLAGLGPLELVPETSPWYSSALHQKARLYMAAGDYKKAHAVALEARKRFPDRKELWGVEAYALLKLRKGGEAEKLLKQALKQYPGDEDLLFSLGSIQHDAGKEADAMRTMEQLITINPKNFQALNYVGYSLAESGKELKRALTLVTAALEQRPDADYIMDSLAWVQFRMGDHEKAWDSINKCLGMGGDDAAIWEHYGDIALALGKKEEAAKGYAESIARNPDNIDAVRKKLTKLKAEAK